MFGFVSSFVSSASLVAAASERETTHACWSVVACWSIIEGVLRIRGSDLASEGPIVRTATDSDNHLRRNSVAGTYEGSFGYVSSPPRHPRLASAIVARPPSTGDRPDRAEVATSPPRSCPTSESPRARFTLPQLDDPRTDEAIDALLAGAERKRGRPAPDFIPMGGREAYAGIESRMSW